MVPGLFQGGCDGDPCFCIVLGVIWAHVTDRGVKFYINQVVVWFYVDDVVAQLPLDRVSDFFGHWQAVFQQFGMRMQLQGARASAAHHRLD